MKKLILSIIVCSFLFLPMDSPAQKRKSKKPVKGPVAAPPKQGKYIRGSRGGCYYVNDKGKKSYVDRSLCN